MAATRVRVAPVEGAANLFTSSSTTTSWRSRPGQRRGLGWPSPHRYGAGDQQPESAAEARWYRDLFDVSVERLAVLRNVPIRGVVLVESLSCVYRMEETLMEDLATGRMSVAQIAQRIIHRARTTDGPAAVHDAALVKRLLQEETDDILARLRATVTDTGAAAYDKPKRSTARPSRSPCAHSDPGRETRDPTGTHRIEPPLASMAMPVSWRPW